MSSFKRYSGCGNTFLVADHRHPFYPHEDTAFTKQLCREAQVDGIIFLENSEKADFAMRTLNADGSEAEMCGNGLRCLGRFVHDLALHSPQMHIETQEAVLHLEVQREIIKAEMPLPHSFRWDIPLENHIVHFVNTGVPHAVHFVNDVESFDLIPFGKYLRHHPAFAPAGTNVNIAEPGTPIKVRTYERGVEAETLACGTGATAVALAAAYQFNVQSPVEIQVRSGDRLTIEFCRNGDQFKKVRMSGKAIFAPLDGDNISGNYRH